MKEVEAFVRIHEQRRRQLPRAVVLGVLAGLAAAAFRGALVAVESLRLAVVGAAHEMGPFGIVLPVALGGIGAAFAATLVRRVAPEAAGSGIPQLKATLQGMRALRSGPLLVVKFVGGAIGIGCGLALGREGPTIQMGGAIGQIVSRWFRCTPRERRTLIAAGAGAGLAAAFNAPLAGLVFVLEEIERRFPPALFTAALIASVLADVVARLLYGQRPVFHIAVPGPPALSVLPTALVLGTIAGVLGVAFNKALVGALDFVRQRNISPAVVGGAVGGMAGLIGFFHPMLPGAGQGLIETALAGDLALSVLLAWFVARFALTVASYATGAPGGIFAPLLVLGSDLGLAAAILGRVLTPWSAGDGATFAVVGMAAYFSAITRAPLTGIVLMVEMTGNYALVLPLLTASLAAYGIADFLGNPPIYETLLDRDLAASNPQAPGLEQAMLVEVAVDAGAPWDGRRVDQLGLPPGCVLVSIRRDGRDEVPTATFALTAGDHVTAVVAPAAAEAIPLLHRGTRGG